MTFKVVIPARYNSSRLPGKPLIEIGGIPMVIHVARKAKLSGADEIIIATDDKRIEKIALEYDFKSVMTNVNHISGTDRIHEVLDQTMWPDETIIINLQGDEPLIDPLLIIQIANGMTKNNIEYATAASLFNSYNDFKNHNNVKVVLGAEDYGIYFSRAMIPYQKDAPLNTLANDIYQHIGIYGYSHKTLKKLVCLEPSQRELEHKLEQLRFLDNNYSIYVTQYDELIPSGIDTLEDVDSALLYIEKNDC